MPYKINRKSRTIAERRYDRDAKENGRIDRAARFSAETGLCPVCRERQSAHGITCGDIECITGFLFWKGRDSSSSGAKQQKPKKRQLKVGGSS